MKLGFTFEDLWKDIFKPILEVPIFPLIAVSVIALAFWFCWSVWISLIAVVISVSRLTIHPISFALLVGETAREQYVINAGILTGALIFLSYILWLYESSAPERKRRHYLRQQMKKQSV